MISNIGVNALTLISLFTLSLLSSEGRCYPENRRVSETALWQILDSLGREMPLTKRNFEQSLGTTLFLEKRDAYKSRWIGEPVVLGSDLGIEVPTLVLDPTDRFDKQSRASLEVVGKCITIDLVQARYGQLTIVDSPRGHSLRDATVYRSRQKWGSFYFAFEEIARDCLSSVSLHGFRGE